MHPSRCQIHGSGSSLGPVNFRFPKRFSLAWWAWAGSCGTGVGLAAVALFWKLGYVPNADVFFWGLVSVVLGDLITVVAFESLAPTEITVGPGEKEEKHSELIVTATVVSGFAGATTGYVNVKGESWAANLTAGDPGSVVPGSNVRVTGREGLTLQVTGGENTSPPTRC